jgi:ADP-L-glycero-D-manno-heptose 6-epimerase
VAVYLVTGGAGFVGSNLVTGLNRHGISDILVVDNLHTGDKRPNLGAIRFAEYVDKDEFLPLLERGTFGETIEAVFHQGACTDTMATDTAYVLRNNTEYSKALLRYALQRRIPFIYASSASVYGNRGVCAERPEHEEPLNLYARSKLLFDQHVRQVLPRVSSTVVGLRYYNVYGPREAHKGRMASMIWQLYRQLKATDEMRLFVGSGGYGDGEQRRDFIWVGDVVDVNLFFLDGPPRQGIFNTGTGGSRTFNDIARSLLDAPRRGQSVVHSLPEGAGREVPELHAGRRDGAPRGGLRPALHVARGWHRELLGGGQVNAGPGSG